MLEHGEAPEKGAVDDSTDRSAGAVATSGSGRPRHGGSSKRTWWKLVVVAVFAALVVVGGILVVAGATALPARGQLVAGRAAMLDGRDALVDGEAAAAAAAFAAAEEEFHSASQRLQRWPLRLAQAVPVARRTVVTLTGVATASATTARAAQELARGLSKLPEGVISFVPENGVIPLQPLTSMQPHVAESAALVAQAEDALLVTPEAFVWEEVADARVELLEQLSAARGSLSAAEALTRGLPGLLGAGGRRTYLLGASTPSEVRGTGGLIGAYAMLTAEDGRLEVSDFRSVTTLPQFAVEDVSAPHADYARRYNEYGGGGFMSNINMTPDFPSAATAIETLYQKATGTALDGTIVADPFALQGMLELTGAVRVPGIGSIDSDTVVPYMLNRAYNDFGDKRTRQKALASVAQAVFDRFLSGSTEANPQQVAQVLAEAVAERHLQFHSTDADVQAALLEAGMAGALPRSDTDFLAVVPNNAAATKGDYYMDWRVRHEVWLEDDGDARATLRVEGHNDLPATGQDNAVIGPYVEYLDAGDSLTLVSVFCAAGCVHTDAEQGRSQIWPGVETDAELGFRTLSTWQWAPSGGTTFVDYTLRLHDVWTVSDTTGGEYELRIQTPPLARPAEVEVIVHPPHPLQITQVRGPAEVRDGAAVWRGKLEAPTTVALELRPPTRYAAGALVARYVQNVRDFWARPLQ